MYFSGVKSWLFDNKSLKQTIFKNTFWLILADIVSSGISFLVIVGMARYFGPVLYGKWAFAISFTSFFVIFADLGLSTLVIREIAVNKDKASEYIDNILAIKFVLGILTFIVIAVLINLFRSNQEEIRLVYLLSIFAITNTFSSFFHAIFKAYEKMEYETICRIVQSVSLLILVFLFIFYTNTIFYVSFAYIISVFIGILISLIFVWNYFSKFFLKINYNTSKKIFIETLPIGLSALTVSIYYFFAPVLLGFVKTSKEVGLYNTAFQTAFLIAPLSTILFSSFFPSISVSFRENTDRLKNIFDKYTTASFIIAIPFCVGGIIIAPQLISFLYKWSYHEAILPFQILVVSMSIGFISSELGSFLLAAKKQKDFFISTLTGAVVNVIANLFLIPKYGVIGAAISNLLAVASVLLVVYINFKKVIVGKFLKYLIDPAIASAVMALILIWLINLKIYNPIYLVLCGVATYFSSLYFIWKIRNKLILISFN